MRSPGSRAGLRVRAIELVTCFGDGVKACAAHPDVLCFPYSPLNPNGTVLARYSVRRCCRVVFNNPFDSFHNTVAEAKKEREQLDRLLTVSTPRERLLVTVIALLLAISIAWLLFGSIARSLTIDGVLEEVGDDLSEAARSVQALVWIENGVLPEITAGMPTVIELGMADGEAETIVGEIAAIATVRLPELPAAFESAAPVSVRRVRVALDDSRDLSSISGRKCRIVIEIGTQSPIALLRPGRS